MALFKAIASLVFMETPVPAGSTVTGGSSVRVDLTLAGASVSSTVVPAQSASAEFDNLAAGDYTVTLSNLDDAGNVIGTPVLVAFTVVDTTVATFFAVTGATVAVTAQ
jgi:hypothetical protein